MIISVILALGSTAVSACVTGITDSVTLHAENDSRVSKEALKLFKDIQRDIFSCQSMRGVVAI